MTPAERAEAHKRKLARQLDDTQIRCLKAVVWLAEHAENETVRLRAASEGLDRIMGRVPEAPRPPLVQVNNTGVTPGRVSLAQLLGLDNIPRAPLTIEGKADE